MVRIAAAIGVMAARRDLALMIEQRVQHVERLAGSGPDQLGEERPEAVGEMGIGLEAGLLAVDPCALLRSYRLRFSVVHT